MKKILIVCCLFYCFSNLSAQSIDPKNEIGLSLTGFNAFGFTSKFESKNKQNRFWRLEAVSIHSRISKSVVDLDNEENYLSNHGLGASFGYEIRKPIVQKFYIFFGFDFKMNAAFSKRESDRPSDNTTFFTDSKTRYIEPGIGIPIGFSYILKDKVNFSIEFKPSFNYRYSAISTIYNEQTGQAPSSTTVEIFSKEKRHEFISGINTQSLKLSIAYRFSKKKSRADQEFIDGLL